MKIHSLVLLIASLFLSISIARGAGLLCGWRFWGRQRGNMGGNLFLGSARALERRSLSDIRRRRHLQRLWARAGLGLLGVLENGKDPIVELSLGRLGGATRVVVLDNLKEGVITPDVHDPALNPLYKDFLTP